jgi:hypothetical protein
VQGSQITGTISGATVPGAAPWTVADTMQQAVSNTAYLVTGATPTVITLPAAPAAGDVVNVVSQGAGGFTLVPSPGQMIVGATVPWATWTPRESARDWRSVAASADGVKLVAGVGGGQIYTSGPGQVSPPVAAPLVGLASSGVSLVYAGSSQWMVVSQQGSLFQ